MTGNAVKQSVLIPDMGGTEGVEIIEIPVSVGDLVSVEDSLLVLESDKATMEVPSPFAGRIVSIHVSTGDSVMEGMPIMEIELSTVSEVPEGSVVDRQSVETDVASVGGGSYDVVDVRVPDIGSDEAEVIEVLVAIGSYVEIESPLIVLESEKATMEVPSPVSGEIEEIVSIVGKKVKEDDLICRVKTEAEKHIVSEVEKKTQVVEGNTNENSNALGKNQNETPKLASPVVQGSVYAGPAVRKLARELGINLTEVSATGPKGRLQKDDLYAYIRGELNKAKTGASLPEVPAVDFGRYGEVESQPLDKIAKLTAESMRRSWLNVPHVTQFDEVDITALEEKRAGMKPEAEKRGLKLTPMAFILKACANALQAHPKLNASLDGLSENLIIKKYCHIGMAVDTPAGLLVPVIKDVNKKDIWQLAQEIIDLSTRAREGVLKPTEMQGGTFTISNLGTIGGQGFTPIINTPEVAILGVSKMQVKPFWDGECFQPTKMLPLSLSYDHRVVNGADAGRFLAELMKSLLQKSD